ncbi:MAG: adenylate/guanylate cyclase domain-containing protein [Alphaproteobacteria bacterium]|nr:adenylate/guanylate cyclase domain-containing protein [Alphaproteobacteria bacterium]
MYLLPLLVLLVATAARLAVPTVQDRLSLICFDLYQRAAPRDPGDLPIRVIDIDDNSIKRVGQWPWPRSTVATLIDKLRDAGAAVVGLDIMFSEQDRTSPALLLPLLTQGGVAPDEAARLLATMPDPDARLGQAIAEMPVVAGFALSDYGGSGTLIDKAGFAFAGAAGQDPLRFVTSYKYAISDLSALQEAAAGNGFLNQYLDYDHVVRRVPLVLRLGAKPTPSLAGETLRLAQGAHGYVGRAAGANTEKSFGENTGLTAIKIGAVSVPTDEGGRVWVHYAPVRRDRFIAAADILEGKFDPARIADNIVLVGSSATGLNDLQATPIASDVPGVEIHAQLIEQILQGTYLSRPDWAVGAETLFALFAGILLILVLPRIGALPSALLGAIAVVTAVGTSWLSFRDAGLLIDPVYPIVVVTAVYLLATLLGYLRTEMRQRAIRSAFSRYMSPHYVEELAKHPEKLVLGGEMKVMTILFCDIRGFTTMAEGLGAEELTNIMNGFLSPMTEIIMAHKGTIDKYIGDCIMAFWNAPLDDPEHAMNAVRAAQDMRKRLIELNQQAWRVAEATGQVYRPLRIGIGINTGECCVGNFGSYQRFDYSLLGDPVNVASRLEGLGKLYGLDLVIGEETAGHLDEPGLVEVDLVAVKGKTQAVRIYTLPPHQIEAQRFFSQHTALLDAYRRRDWETALHLLDDGGLTAEPQLAPVYELYRRRIAHFQAESPPGDWNGVFTAEEK